MKVLMISGDAHLLRPGTAAAQRLALQRTVVDEVAVYVWPRPHGALRILQDARRGRFDVVTTQDPFFRGAIGLIAARLCGARLNLQVHVDLAGVSRWRRALASFLLRRADTVRVVSARVRAELPSDLHARISVLPLYINVQPFAAVVRAPSERLKTLLWIGRFEAEKDPLFALELFARIRGTERIDARLVMLGAGTMGNELRERAVRLNIEHQVEFPGWQDPKAYLRYADVVFSTSRYESWGASIIEALAAGVPVVAPDVGIAREAGAIITSRARMAEALLDVLQSGARGTLRLPLITDAAAWAAAWRDTL